MPSTRIVIGIERAVPSPQPPDFTAGYFAVTGGPDVHERPRVWPTCQLHPMPDVSAARAGDIVTVNWTPVEPDVAAWVKAYRLYHAAGTGSPWTLIAETTGTTAVHHIAPSCAGYYAIKLLLDGNVETTVMSEPYGPVDGALADRDADTIADTCDNCLDVPNPDQFDHDGDGLGDYCDPPAVGDGPWLEVRKHRESDGTISRNVDVFGRGANESVAVTSGPLRSPFVHDHGTDAGGLTRCNVAIDSEILQVLAVPATGNWYFLAAMQLGTTLDWGRASDGIPRPQPSAPCP